jgi:hypothetical protein
MLVTVTVAKTWPPCSTVALDGLTETLKSGVEGGDVPPLGGDEDGGDVPPLGGGDVEEEAKT